VSIYDLVKERYEREAQETARKKAEEEARQQRETALRRDAAKIATALAAGGVRHTAAHTNGWHLGTQTSRGATRVAPEPGLPGSFAPSTIYTHDWQLSESGGIYRNAELREKLTDGEMGVLEDYLADLAVTNRLDPELFKDGDT
jgi:hypothetical protein